MTITKNGTTAPIRRVDFSRPFAKTSLPSTSIDQVLQGAQDRAQQQPQNKLHELRPVEVRLGSYTLKEGGR
jgi:hypothetical protein